MDGLYLKLQVLAETDRKLKVEVNKLIRFVTLLRQKIYRIHAPYLDTFVVYLPKDGYTAALIINAMEAYCYFHGVLHDLRDGNISLQLVEVGSGK
jgi:hypothetical protein